jgi:hypothetical protein
MSAVIYCRTKTEISEMRRKHPDVDATWKQIPVSKMEDNMGTPIVCKSDDDAFETCPVGEKYIDELPKVNKSSSSED